MVNYTNPNDGTYAMYRFLDDGVSFTFGIGGDVEQQELEVLFDGAESGDAFVAFLDAFVTAYRTRRAMSASRESYNSARSSELGGDGGGGGGAESGESSMSAS